MKQPKIFRQALNSTALLTVAFLLLQTVLIVLPTLARAQIVQTTPTTNTTQGVVTECNDSKDNDGDGTADWNGVKDSNGLIIYRSDPNCADFNPAHPDPTIHEADTDCNDGIDNDSDGLIDGADPDCQVPHVAGTSGPFEGGLVPCENKCDLNSAFALINKLVDFLIKVVFFPISIIMFMYTGARYILSEGKPNVRAQVKKLIGHLIGGIVLILCAWVIVKTILVVLGYKEALVFFQ
ncbi:MAG TPA: pilin [Candidatus Paceibacterota bacterium]|nr:pilin [Candidatus Paceibacterota bacterium]